MTAPALAAISRLDDGLAISGDCLLAARYDAALSAQHHRREQQVEGYLTDRCYCGALATGGECINCHNDAELAVVRSWND
jgi:hypothetical protein